MKENTLLNIQHLLDETHRMELVVGHQWIDLLREIQEVCEKRIRREQSKKVLTEGQQYYVVIKEGWFKRHFYEVNPNLSTSPHPLKGTVIDGKNGLYLQEKGSKILVPDYNIETFTLI